MSIHFRVMWDTHAYIPYSPFTNPAYQRPTAMETGFQFSIPNQLLHMWDLIPTCLFIIILSETDHNDPENIT